MARSRDDGLLDQAFDLLLQAPWWGGLVLAILATIPFGVMLPSFAPAVFMAFLLAWGVAELQKLSRRRLASSQTGLDSVRALSWQEFEYLVGEAYRRRGYRVVETGSAAGDGGIDLELHGHGERVLVQCKQWRTQRVGVGPVRELYGVLMGEGADRAIFVTSGTYTSEAGAFADGKPLELVDGDGLTRLIGTVQADTPQAPSPEVARQESPVCPSCGKRMVLRTARRGNNRGSRFWGCSRYPACRGTRQHHPS